MPAIVNQALEIGASYFEVATAMALHCFSDADVDVEILEAGVGARLDATTAVPADMGLLTPIAVDHQAWLGDTLEAISSEKAHVFDNCRWRISAAQQTIVKQQIHAHADGVLFPEQAFPDIPLRMPGHHQRQNAALAMAAVEVLQSHGKIDKEQTPWLAIGDAVAPGRLQMMMRGEQCFCLDAAHNRHAVETLLVSLPELGPFDAIFVFTREDRNLSNEFSLLRPFTKRLISDNKAAGNADASYPELSDALDAETTIKNGRFLILGSFLSVAAGEDWIKRQKH